MRSPLSFLLVFGLAIGLFSLMAQPVEAGGHGRHGQGVIVNQFGAFHHGGQVQFVPFFSGVAPVAVPALVVPSHGFVPANFGHNQAAVFAAQKAAIRNAQFRVQKSNVFRFNNRASQAKRGVQVQRSRFRIR